MGIRFTASTVVVAECIALATITMGCAAQHVGVQDGQNRPSTTLDSASRYEAYVRHPSTRAVEMTHGVVAALRTAATRPLEIHFIDVGQGDSTLIRCPNGSHILIDAGTTSGADSEPVRDYILERIGPDAPELDTLIITHADGDHYSMLPDVLSEVSIGHTYHVGDFSHYESSEFQDWLRAIPASKRTKLRETYYDPANDPNEDIDCGAADVYVLAANVRSNFSWKNTRSIVVMLRLGAFEAILTGDATKDTEKAILARYTSDWLDVDVLKMGHHGSSATSTTQAWADTVQPEISVASAAWKSGHGHPRKEVVDRLAPYAVAWAAHPLSSSTGSKGRYRWHYDENYGKAIFSTATNGTIVVTTTGAGDYEIIWFDYGE